ncbi:uncharacterized protein LOC116657619 isoform X2 [Camelus ferus]|uniref:Uncharacterized protein LOC116657619 isoform X2 n=1 Tax=Camelus ferus TaxID=419612 RepID=A0A8B8RG21_CAMFR|nr:uncharacterized protein LOC116657619 isoform X2 [Camelus ferus]
MTGHKTGGGRSRRRAAGGPGGPAGPRRAERQRRLRGAGFGDPSRRGQPLTLGLWTWPGGRGRWRGGTQGSPRTPRPLPPCPRPCLAAPGGCPPEPQPAGKPVGRRAGPSAASSPLQLSSSSSASSSEKTAGLKSYRLSLSYYLKKMTDSGQFLKGHPTSIKLADTEGQTAARRIKQFLGNSKNGWCRTSFFVAAGHSDVLIGKRVSTHYSQ